MTLAEGRLWRPAHGGPRDGTGREPVRVLLLSSCVSLGESRDPLTHLKSVRKGPACGRRYLNNAHHSYSPMRTAGLGVHSLVGILAVFRFSGSPTSVCIKRSPNGEFKGGFLGSAPRSSDSTVQVGPGDARFAGAPASRMR